MDQWVTKSVPRCGANVKFSLTTSGGNHGSAGAMVPNTLAHYTPFGDWRTEPTQTMTDRGFTGHRSNNKGAGDMGLIYMNARFYLPGVGRFVSADSLVPDPANPQSFNRYSYVLNSPINATDPTGHFCFPSRHGSQICSLDDDRSVVVPRRQQVVLYEWEEQLGAQTIYSETSNGQYPIAEAARIAHVYINRVVSGPWNNMWEATRPPQSAIGELWGESWKHDPPLPIPVALVDAVEKVEEWYARLQYTMSLGTEPFASGWANSKRAFNLALAETKNGIDPTNGSTWFVALGRTQRPNESREQFQQRFWADYEREAREFSAYAAQNPNFAWSITPAESVIILSGGAEMIAVITGTAPCVYTMECNP